MSEGKEDAGQLVKVRRNKFLKLIEAIHDQLGQWALVWMSGIHGICLADYPEYDLSLYIDETAHFESKGYVHLTDEWNEYERLLVALDAKADETFPIKQGFPAGFKYKLAGVWARSDTVVKGEVDPYCDVILDYQGEPIDSNTNHSSIP